MQNLLVKAADEYLARHTKRALIDQAMDRITVDYADALSCEGLATPDQLTASMRTKFRFPWDNTPLCR